MRRTRAPLILAAALVLLLVACVPSIYAQASPTLTTDVTESALVQATINGYPGILANLTDTTPASLQAIVYVDLTNAAGQTVYWNYGACSLGPGELAQCFVPLLGAPAGNLTATVFATTAANVPVSTPMTVQVTM